MAKSSRVALKLGVKPGKLVRFSFLHVHKAHLNSESNKEEYSVQLLIPKTNTEDVKGLKDAVAACLKAEFTDQKKKVPPGAWICLRDGDTDTKTNGDSYGDAAKGHYVLNAKADLDHKPKVVGTVKIDGEPQPIGPEEIKSGDWGRVAVNLYGYSKGKGGVGCGLDVLQRVQEGEALGSSVSAKDAFGEYDDEDDVL
jgi:hypothetical protein